MSHYAKLMLWAAIAVVFAYTGFFISMSDGLTIGDRSPMFMALAVIGFLGTVGIIIFVQQWLSKPTARAFPDERERLLDGRSEQVGARILEAGVFAVIALVIYEASTGPGGLGTYSLMRPEALVFALITINAIAAVARMITAIVQDVSG